jgi:hypothetical protein
MLAKLPSANIGFDLSQKEDSKFYKVNNDLC